MLYDVDMSAKSLAQDCTLCNGDSASAMDEKTSYQAPICVDPDCPQSVCEECSDHEECCQECVQEDRICEDCSGHQECCEECVEDGCGILDLIDCAGPQCEYHKDYVCDGSCFELFGDQAAEMFGLGALPELPMEYASGNSTRPEISSAWNSTVDVVQHKSDPSLPRENFDGALRESAEILIQAAAISTVVNPRDSDKSSLLFQSNPWSYTAGKHDSSHSMQTRMNSTTQSPSKPLSYHSVAYVFAKPALFDLGCPMRRAHVLSMLAAGPMLENKKADLIFVTAASGPTKVENLVGRLLV